ncbi:hypothetical protein IEQ34_023045 [Dendrobium chrysotoxum]|uniref:Uncharacterized protein n=1 Tax=Dendrobium chrysotoxum TaxID=161865 RepID=A0AAV7FZ46_DENCH|nr:hypothetical protein IEQ34_023045 [Dendrobium chrysotoxum]
MEHFSCFPNLGKIKVHGLMVKKKSFFYHLSDSMAIKHVFEELSGTLVLHLNASSMQNALQDRSSVPFALNLSLSNSSPHGDNQTQKSVRLNVADYRRLSPISNDGAEFFQPDVYLTRINAKFSLSEEEAEMRF